MKPEIITDRLALRRGAAGDFDAIHEIFSFPEVARMTASWPIPADPERTLRICQPMADEEGIAGPILLDGQIIGSMGCHRTADGSFNIGYGMHPRHWGKGYASEMGRALIAACFQRYDPDRITAGVWEGNPASDRVLEKLGFRHTHVGLGYCLARGEAVPSRMYELTRAEWLAANPLSIETPRLNIRAYAAGDIPALHRIATDPDVAQMILSFSAEDTLEKVTNWVLDRRYRGQSGFCAGVFLKDGTLIGNVGLAPGGASTMYFYGRDFWGRGYATEAQRAFLDWAFRTYTFDTIEADHFHDNPASGRVMTKLGFENIGEGTHQSGARLEPELVILYRLTRDRFEGIT